MSALHLALARFSDEQLRSLLDARPDAAFPPPPSLASLATRLTLTGSIARSLRRLTAADIALLETLGDAGAELDPVALDAVNVPFDSQEPLARLRTNALVFGPDKALRVSPGVLSALPAGWRILDPAPDNLTEALEELSPRERQVLDTLAASGSIGTTRGAAPDADPTLPVPRLLSLGLLVRVNSSTVRLPRPVREALRGTPVRTYPLEPVAPTNAVEQSRVDAASTAAGLESVRQVRRTIMHLLESPVELLKDGSVGVRARAALEKELGFDPDLSVTVAEAAGLVGRGEIDNADCLAATRDGVTWLDSTLPEQWAVLILGWLASPWRTELDTKLLGEDSRAPEIRFAKLSVVKRLCAGAMDGETLSANLHHYSPILASGTSPALLTRIVKEGHAIGVLALHTAAAPGRAVVEGADLTAATRELVPAEIDYVIAQADLTILAPGPLPPDMAAMLESFADLESPGMASVYRVTPASVQRALNAGRTGGELTRWLEKHCVGEVPQGLLFAINDAAATHGSLRVGAAASYLRCEDEALLASAAARVDGLELIAPTVAISQMPASQLVTLLRRHGFQPAADHDGEALLQLHNAPQLVAPTPSTVPRERGLDEARREEIIRSLRAAGGAPDTEERDFLETLRASARARRQVTIGYVDKRGQRTQRSVTPITVNAGLIDALDESTGRVVRVELSRITGVDETPPAP
ncbi:helicase-associated domain-containing protein [Corynebacterium sanguinis]|uniref:helicase-associated domain-containing protein n=2 Tax=Corynebacteriaceae TaxID=1653 RepID=UPI00223AF8B7|nr:helicase-associated domain-containing protein [Corynebacterium sanguinis]MCT1584494.1 helicase-associated domain-containing protein [Corynebacterium sanguinis]MCT2046796.1 helicase-associated domain-containing protein [Corynebacterium sanguinis]